MGAHSEKEREMLTQLIQQWNENRLDLFALSQPNQYLEFHGVMRFYFQETGQKVATKCLRVSSTATTTATIEALIEKFHPDLRMLTTPQYSLWEVHENGEERRLMPEERPLLVQLTWHKDDREGRFLLKRHDQQLVSLTQLASADNNQPSMKRKLSRREKKEMRKQQKRANSKTIEAIDGRSREAEDVGGKLYEELPPTTFTRTISNPEIVMKKRRERKLHHKLLQMGEGGSLKVYGGSLNPEKPYVTLLVSNRDRADKLVRETLDKYGFDNRAYPDFCLVEVVIPLCEKENAEFGQVPALSERIVGDDEVPLQLLEDVSTTKGSVVFHVRRRPPDAPRGRVSRQHSALPTPTGPPTDNTSYLVPLSQDGSEMGGSRPIPIMPNVTEVGSDRQLVQMSQAIPLQGPYVQGRHCVFASSDGVVTITPCSPTAEVEVNGSRIQETTILRSGAVVRIGRYHMFRLVEQSLSGSSQYSAPTPDPLEFETTFDVDGLVTTQVYGGGVAVVNHDAPSRSASFSQPFLSRNVIPAIIELPDVAEDGFLRDVIRDVSVSTLQFKLAPVYVMYMCCRYRVSPHYRTSCSTEERKRLLGQLLTKTTNLLHVTIQDHCHDCVALSFWMANSSELLNFIKLDPQLSLRDPQESLADAVEKAFAHLCACLKQDLNQAMPAVLDPNLDEHSSVAPCLHMLNGAITLLRSCRVNAALTIQLFSHLFHYINMYLFNWLVSREGYSYCCRSWGLQLSSRLRLMQDWALEHGLEMAAECHLDRILQAAKLLQTPKTVDNLATLGATCYKLNSVQVRSLLERYRTETGEQRMCMDLVDNVCELAANQADQIIVADGRNVQVEEEVDLQLPFLLPEDGYSCELVRGIPPPLQQFVDSLQHKGVCRMILQPASSGEWTVHLGGANSEEAMSSQPNIATITFEKQGGIGLHIVQVFDEELAGIYVKKVVANSAAGNDGRLEVGDQLLKVNGLSLVGITQEEAAARMAGCGPTVCFEVAKRAAIYKGLAAQLYAPPTEEPQTITSVPMVSNMAGGQVQHGRSLSASHLHHHTHQPLQYENVHAHVDPAGQSQSHSMSRSMDYHRRTVSPSPLYSNTVAARQQQQHVRAPSVDAIGVYRANSMLTDYHNLPLIGGHESVGVLGPAPYRARAPAVHPVSVATTPSPSSVPPAPLSPREPYVMSSSVDKSPRSSLSNHEIDPPLQLQNNHVIQSPNNHVIQSPNNHVIMTEDQDENINDKIDSEVIRLMEEEVHRLETRPNLNEDEHRRYRALKYELAYKSRLTEPDDDVTNRDDQTVNNGGRSDEVNYLSELHEYTHSHTPSHNENHMHANHSRLDHRMQMLEESLQHKPLAPHNAFVAPQNTFVAAENTSDDIASLHTHVQHISLHDQNNGVSSRKVPPQVLPKKKVQLQPPPPPSHPFIQEQYVELPPPPPVEQSHRYVYSNAETEPPRVQVLGRQEVYRDPRQRRLEQQQQISQRTKGLGDGAALPFKEKMKLFAQQIGETTPKEKMKASSAQREIEVGIAAHH